MKCYKYKIPSDETLYMLRNKYSYFKVLIINEISLIGRETFEDIDLELKVIRRNSLPFNGVFLLVVRYFLQLRPIHQKGVFLKSSKGVRDHIGHSVDSCGKKSSCMSWLRMCRVLIKILFNYLIKFEKVSKQIIM